MGSWFQKMVEDKACPAAYLMMKTKAVSRCSPDGDKANDEDGANDEDQTNDGNEADDEDGADDEDKANKNKADDGDEEPVFRCSLDDKDKSCCSLDDKEEAWIPVLAQ